MAKFAGSPTDTERSVGWVNIMGGNMIINKTASLLVTLPASLVIIHRYFALLSVSNMVSGFVYVTFVAPKISFLFFCH